MTQPLYNPTPRVLVNGEYANIFHDLMLEMLVEQQLDAPTRCQAKFSNWGSQNGEANFLFFDRDVLNFGNPFTIEVEQNGDRKIIFDGVINALEAGYYPDRTPDIIVYAQHLLEQLCSVNRTRTFEHMSVPDVFDSIASEHGVQFELNLLGNYPGLDIIAQFDQTDLALLYDLANDLGWSLGFEDGIVKVRDHLETASSIQLVFGRNLRSAKACADLSRQVSEFGVSGWDVDNKVSHIEIANESHIMNELNGLQGGGEILSDLYGSIRRVEHLSQVRSTEQAAVLAQAAYRQNARRFVTLVAVTEGNPSLHAGGIVDVQGVGQMFNGAYLAAAVRHRFQRESGYYCEVELVRAGIGPQGLSRALRRRKSPFRKPVQKQDADKKIVQNDKLMEE